MHFIHSGLFLHHCLIAEVLDHFILELFLHPLQSFTSVLLIVISLLLFHFSVVVVDAILVEVFRRCHYVLFGSLFPFAFLHPLVVANFDRELRHFIFIEQSKDDTQIYADPNEFLVNHKRQNSNFLFGVVIHALNTQFLIQIKIHSHMIPYQKPKQEFKQGLQFNFRGDKELLLLLNLKVELSFTAQKPFITSIPIIPIFPQTEERNAEQIIEPLVGFEVFGEPQKDFIIKNKSLIKENTIYIYFPSNIRVDEKVNKIFVNSYESIIKEIPRNMRNNFAKLILYEQGVGQNSIEQQKNKIYDILHTLIKVNLEKRLELYNSQISNLRNNDLNMKNLLILFKNKLMLAFLFRKIGIDQMCSEKLELVWQDMLYNQKFFTDNTTYKKDVLYLPPYIERSYQAIVKDFNNPDSFLKVCSFTFFKCYEMQLELMNYCQAMKNLKKFIDFCCGTSFNIIKSNKQELLKNIWALTVIDEAYEVAHRLGRAFPTFLNQQRQAEYYSLTTYIAKKYRQSIEKIGEFLYNFNYREIYPKTLQTEVEQCLKDLNNSNKKIVCSNVEDSNIVMQKIQQNLLLVFGGYQSYKLLYLKSLINLYEILNRSTNKRNARAVKLLVLKTYLSIIQPPNLEFSQHYLTKFSSPKSDVYAYIDKILMKAEKCTLLDEEDGYINDTVFKRSLRYSTSKDDLINRNKDDQTLWPQLKFYEDYLKFIILLISYRNEHTAVKHKEQNPLNISFSKSIHKIPVKTDNIIHLLLNQDLIALQIQWSLTVNLVREIFALQKGQQLKLQEKIPINVRMGILLDARINENPETDQHLIIRVNNKQLSNLSFLSQHPMIDLQLQIMDVNKVTKVIKLHLISMAMLPNQMMELRVAVQHKQCLIFIVRQLRVKIGLLSCYYVNKSLQIEEIKALQEEQRKAQKKKSRKYSSFEEKLRQQEFVHMVNKADHLALAHIRYHTLSIAPVQAHNAVKASNHKQSIDFRDSSSQSSLYNLIKDKSVTIPVYADLWTPITYIIKANPLSKVSRIRIPLHKIEVTPSQREEVSDWVRIDGRWVSKNSDEIVSTDVSEEGIQLMLMIKCRNVKQTRNSKKARKDSSMSKSGFSSKSNASWQEGGFLRLQLEIMQDEYCYLLENSLYYHQTLGFQTKYMYCEELQEYTLQNVCKEAIKVYHSSSQEPQLLKFNEQVKLQSSEVEIQIDLEGSNEQEATIERPVFKNKINLQSRIRKQLLRPEKLETCDLKIHNIQKGSSLKRFEVIKIKSTEAGILSVLDAGSGFQLIGKVQGELCLSNEGVIDLFLLPIKTGKLILPNILIGGKKGVWKDGILLSIIE